jgi:Lrp/AsnC family transcriptional regulator for asnA, asnC and gidA
VGHRLSGELDTLDKELIRLLCKDGQAPVADLAKRLAVTTPTVRTRIKRLIKSGLLKIAGSINTQNHPELISALVAMKVQSFGKLEEVLKNLASIDQVIWAGVVTGRHDIFAEIVVAGGIGELHALITNIIPRVGKVVQTETFVVTKSVKKWISLPQGMKEW